MDILLFFGLFFFSLVLAIFYYAKGVIYLGVLSAMILLFLGIFLAATGNIDMTFCFSDEVNATVTGNLTSYVYERSCYTETLVLSRNTINAIGIILMIIGGFMGLDFINYVRAEPEKKRALEVEKDL